LVPPAGTLLSTEAETTEETTDEAAAMPVEVADLRASTHLHRRTPQGVLDRFYNFRSSPSLSKHL
jgi:hypothetical protein